MERNPISLNGKLKAFNTVSDGSWISSCFGPSTRSGRTEWLAIARFYEQLVRISPTLGTRTGYAAAVADANGREAGLAVLDSIDADTISCYPPYSAVRAHLLQGLGDTAEALEAYDRAIGLAEDPAVREFLLQKRGLIFFFLCRNQPTLPVTSIEAA